MPQETIRQKAWLVFLGAMCGVIPVLTSNWLEQGSKHRQLRVEQRLTVLKDYARACNEAAIVMNRLIAYADAPESSAPGALESIEKDLTAAALNQATQTHLILGLFGSSVPLSKQPLLDQPAKGEDLAATLKKWQEALPGALSGCEADVKVLVGRLDQ